MSSSSRKMGSIVLDRFLNSHDSALGSIIFDYRKSAGFV